MNATAFVMTVPTHAMAQTLGAVLRQYALGAVRGTATTAVRIDGIQHEFGRIPGVEESVLEILENVRRAPVSGLVDEAVWLRASLPAKGVLRLADFNPTAGIEFPVPNYPLATVMDGDLADGREIRIRIASGSGDQMSSPAASTKPGELPLSGDFSPVRRAWWRTEEVGEGCRLRLALECSPGTAGKEALGEALAALASDVRQLFDLEVTEGAQGEFTSCWIPAGRADGLATLVEAAILFRQPGDPAEADVSWHVSHGDVLDHPGLARFTVSVEVFPGDSPREHLVRAMEAIVTLVAEARTAVPDGVTCDDAQQLPELPAEPNYRVFCRMSGPLVAGSPVKHHLDSFARFCDTGESGPDRYNLGWLLERGLCVDAGDAGRCELVEWGIAEDGGESGSASVWALARATWGTDRALEQRMTLGELPLIDDCASFRVRGRRRACVAQLVQAPGVYFSYDGRRQACNAEIVPHHGESLHLSLRKSGNVSVRVGKSRTMSAATVLAALGWDGSGTGSPAMSAALGGGLCRSVDDAVREMAECLGTASSASGDASVTVEHALFDVLSFDLGTLGRRRLNDRLAVDGESEFVTAADIAAVIERLLELRDAGEGFDDREHMQHLIARCVGESLFEHARSAMSRVKDGIRSWLEGDAERAGGDADDDSLQSVVEIAFNDAFRRFFWENSLAREVADANPLAVLAQARQVTRSGPGGLNKRTTGLPPRYIHPSQYGRLCVIDTPEGDNLGLLRSFALHVRIDEDGFLLAPYRSVTDGAVADDVVYLHPADEDQYLLLAGDAVVEEDGRLGTEPVVARHGYEYERVPACDVDYVGASPAEIFGAPAHAIPLIEYDDPNRSLMGANMSRQAVPVAYPDRPLLASGFEDSLMTFSHADAAVVTSVAPGGGSALPPGRNVLVAYMCWEGYNFEDAIVISDRLIRNGIFTSYHVRTFELTVRRRGDCVERLSAAPLDAVPESCRHLDRYGIAREGAEVRAGDVLVGKVVEGEEGKSEGASLWVPRGCAGRVVSVVRETHASGVVLPTEIEERVRLTVVLRRPLQVGDKLANRHGAKGIVGIVVPEADMPHLADGTSVDMLCNPLGVPSRMNMGQIVEAHVSLAARTLGIGVVSPPMSGVTPDDLAALLAEAGLPKDGRLQLHDGRTGRAFDQPTTVGVVYWQKLGHMVDDVFQARSTGAYDPTTLQPVRGRKRRGGQKVGKMEIWALQSHGAAHNLREFLSIKADDAVGRRHIYEAIVAGREDELFRVPESANILLHELRAACLEVSCPDDQVALADAETVDIGRVGRVQLTLAPPEKVREWSRGQVSTDEMFDAVTGLPIPGGLFCPEIFGTATGGGRATDEGEHEWRAPFRRMGHIELAAPVLHPWLKSLDPNPICVLLQITRDEMLDVLYCRKRIVVAADDSGAEHGMLMDDDEYRAARERWGYGFEVGMGADGLAHAVRALDPVQGREALLAVMQDASPAERAEAVLLFEALAGDPEACERVLLRVLPVLPAGLRPAVSLGDNRWGTSDLNELYERVIRRNLRLRALLQLQTPDIMLRDEQRLLQEAVDALFGNGYRGHSVRGQRDVTLASLSDRLKGPKGRFIQSLAGKRVDYTARSVIAPGPEIGLDECGVPRILGLELFRPFVVGDLLRSGAVRTRRQAEHFVDRQRREALEALERVTRDKVVLIVRAPALHKYSMLAFRPVLTDDKAIRIHPLTNIGFNADFDGDQMTLHVPLSRPAQEEAKRLLMASNNLFGTASGRLMNRPSQEMIQGCYYMTLVIPEGAGAGRSFGSSWSAINAWKAGEVTVQAPIRLTDEGGAAQETTVGRILFNRLLPEGVPEVESAMGRAQLEHLLRECRRFHGGPQASVLADAIKSFGFAYVTLSGMSFWRSGPAVSRARVLAEADEAARAADARFAEGDVDAETRYLELVDLWEATQETMRNQVMTELNQAERKLSPISLMLRSGARCSSQQMLMLYGMNGLTVDMFGRIIEYPVRECMVDPVSQLSYFMKANGARGGLAMTVLRIASAGDLMRRIVEALEDVLIVTDDCGTTRGIPLAPAWGNERVVQSFRDRVVGRVAVEDVSDRDGQAVVKAGDWVTEEQVAVLVEAGLGRLRVRSPMTCEAQGGVCAVCYGLGPARHERVVSGTPVGITAALSLGEPLTQLTMRSFHLGHRYPFSKIARGKPEQDVKYSSAFPRLEEVFEMLEKRRAYGPALDGVDERPLPQEVLDSSGEDAARVYILDELARVYGESGVSIDCRHYEIAARQMMSFIQVVEPGDTQLVPGQRLKRDDWERANAEMASEGRRPATAESLLLPITDVALRSGSFLAAAASWETVRVLGRAGLLGEIDQLRGMRENIILGRLIPVLQPITERQ